MNARKPGLRSRLEATFVCDRAYLRNLLSKRTLKCLCLDTIWTHRRLPCIIQYSSYPTGCAPFAGAATFRCQSIHEPAFKTTLFRSLYPGVCIRCLPYSWQPYIELVSNIKYQIISKFFVFVFKLVLRVLRSWGIQLVYICIMLHVIYR